MAMGVNAVAIAFVAIAAYIGSGLESISWRQEIFGKLFGGFVNRNHFAFYLNLCIGCGLGLWLHQVQRLPTSRRFLQDGGLMSISAGLVVLMAALISCQSRGGVASMLAAAIVVGYVYRARASWKRYKLLCAAVPVLTLLFVYWIDIDVHQSRVARFFFGEETSNPRLMYVNVDPIHEQ